MRPDARHRCRERRRSGAFPSSTSTWFSPVAVMGARPASFRGASRAIGDKWRCLAGRSRPLTSGRAARLPNTFEMLVPPGRAARNSRTAEGFDLSPAGAYGQDPVRERSTPRFERNSPRTRRSHAIHELSRAQFARKSSTAASKSAPLRGSPMDPSERGDCSYRLGGLGLRIDEAAGAA